MLNLAGAIGSLPYVGIVVAAGLFYNTLVDNPIVRAEARAGLVAVSELEAVKATLAEKTRQEGAAQAASDNFAEVIRRQAQAVSVKEAEQEKQNAAYEARLLALGRQCLLNGDDIRELSR